MYLPAATLSPTELAALPSWTLSARQLCDLEMLGDGSFAPLTGFLGAADHASVCAEMRLASGTLWPMPITLDVSEAFAASLAPDARIALRDAEGVALAMMTVTEQYRPDKLAEARAVFGTDDPIHPGVSALVHGQPIYLGGPIEMLARPSHYDFPGLRRTPAELKALFAERGWERIVAFQTRNPLHRAHVELTLRATEQANAHLLLNPVVGQTKPGDIDHYSRVRCYQHALKHYPEGCATLSLLPLAMRMGGPREALWHALIRKNLGCTHFIVGRDHAGPGKNSQGRDFYEPYAAQQLALRYADEIGITILPFEEMVYVKNRDGYVERKNLTPEDEPLSISGTQFRQALMTGAAIPEWFSYPEVVAELRRTHPPRQAQGFTVFFTGLSGAGKSTLANALRIKLLERGGRRVTLLDGDLVRQHLSSELGFSRAHRDLNIQRIAYVASEVTKHGGAAICAPIAPYAGARQTARALIGAEGGFVEVHVATPIEVCEQRDRKGLYAKARAGLLTGFTGIDDPYEAPEHPELSLDTSTLSVEEGVARILAHLEHEGYLTPDTPA